MIGSAFVIVGGSIFHDWYAAYIEPVLTRTSSRPKVTRSISLNTALLASIYNHWNWIISFTV